MVLHMPFRAWCPHCVKGRTKSEPHRTVEEKEEETVPTIFHGLHVDEIKGRKRAETVQ